MSILDVISIILDPAFLVFCSLILILVIYIVKKIKQKPDKPSAKKISKKFPAAVAPKPRRGRGNILRNRRAVAGDSDSGSGDDFGPGFGQEEEDAEVADIYDQVTGDGKIGAKKRRKLEMRAEKRAQREAEVMEREDRKQREEEQKKIRIKIEEREKAEEAAREAREKLEREEREQREYEEYLKLKEEFEIEEQGFDEQENLDENQQLLQEFIKQVKNQKVVVLEELASQYKMKTQEIIDRIQALQESSHLMGVFDDRGKFIHISREELTDVARFINNRGRICITELVESSNKLINLNPATTTTEVQ